MNRNTTDSTNPATPATSATPATAKKASKKAAKKVSKKTTKNAASKKAASKKAAPSKKATKKKTTKKAATTRGSTTGKKAAGTKVAGAADPQRAKRVYQTLRETYPDAECALKHKNAYELLVATILSAQCTDERVNKTTPELFAKYPTPQDLAESEQEDVEQIIRSCGFYRNKTKSIRTAAQGIVENFGGEVPKTMEELITLPGVARKTANVVLGVAFGINEGVVVDTHVKRLSNRLGFTQQSNTDRIEKDLMALFPQEWWDMLAHLLIFHGRQTCTARKPDCEHCPLNADCPKIGVTTTRTG